jgi:hypothetical protein
MILTHWLSRQSISQLPAETALAVLEAVSPPVSVVTGLELAAVLPLPVTLGETAPAVSEAGTLADVVLTVEVLAAELALSAEWVPAAEAVATPLAPELEPCWHPAISVKATIPGTNRTIDRLRSIAITKVNLPSLKIKAACGKFPRPRSCGMIDVVDPRGNLSPLAHVANWRHVSWRILTNPNGAWLTPAVGSKDRAKHLG